MLPGEVIISLSEAHKVPNSIKSALQNRLWKFPVNVIMTDQKKYAGDNRNIASQNAKGDILVCQDADDLPYPQRLEIIEYFFNTYPISQLLHGWIKGDKNVFNNVTYYALNDVPYIFPTSYQNIWSFKVHFGNVAISRQVFKSLQWTSMPRGQDVEFNQRVYNRFRQCIIIRVPLLVYRIGCLLHV